MNSKEFMIVKKEKKRSREEDKKSRRQEYKKTGRQEDKKMESSNFSTCNLS